MDRLKTIVLGASGLVAQRLQQRLYQHPWFELSAIAGRSERKGEFLDSIQWKLDEKRPTFDSIKIEDVYDADLPKKLYDAGIRVAFSALPSKHALQVEPMWAQSGITVFSNASSYRQTEGVPLVIPEINRDMLTQLGAVGYPLACATNCTLLPIIIPLTPLHRAFGLRSFSVRTEQALSGGGYRLLDHREGNSEPLNQEIPGEAEKTEAEFRRILEWTGTADIVCKRVDRKDGHFVAVTAQFETDITTEEVQQCLDDWNTLTANQQLPSAPFSPMMIQSNLDVNDHLFGNGIAFEGTPDPSKNLKTGMAIIVASIESLDSRTVSFEAYSHNTIRGAAGGVVYLAELAYSMHLL
jgi:aspartate-semialdehyde dehydrogenase